MCDIPRVSTPKKNSDRPSSGPKTTREERLKAALKANMARRKAQARARAVDDSAKVAAKNEQE